MEDIKTLVHLYVDAIDKREALIRKINLSQFFRDCLKAALYGELIGEEKNPERIVERQRLKIAELLHEIENLKKEAEKLKQQVKDLWGNEI